MKRTATLLLVLLMGCGDGEDRSESEMERALDSLRYCEPQAAASIPEVDEEFDFFTQKYVAFDPQEAYERGYELGYGESLLLYGQGGDNVMSCALIGVKFKLGGGAWCRYSYMGIEAAYADCMDRIRRARRQLPERLLKQAANREFERLTEEDAAGQSSQLVLREINSPQ